MLACIYAGPLIGIWLLADASWAAEPVGIVYFLLCVRAVASSSTVFYWYRREKHITRVCL